MYHGNKNYVIHSPFVIMGKQHLIIQLSHNTNAWMQVSYCAGRTVKDYEIYRENLKG